MDDSIEASSKACGRHLWLGNKMSGLRTGPLEFPLEIGQRHIDVAHGHLGRSVAE